VRKIRTYHEVEGDQGATLVAQVVAQRARLARRLESVRAVVAVASGKGGVGKSAITANLAVALATEGCRVGALDADLNGPSLARMLGVIGRGLEDGPDGVRPVTGAGGVRVVSMELLQKEADAPLRWKDPGGDAYLWRGSMETGALREFLSDVAWGELDVLLVDVPPGTDRIARLLELVPAPEAVLLVTTPSEMARAVVSRSARLLREAGVARVGLVSNMTELVCPDCGKRTPLYQEDGGRRLAEESGLEEWARIPFDPVLASATDRGDPLAVSDRSPETARAFGRLARRLLDETAP
jgi:ATP-binding protein involved in chromosome partitioning